MERRLKFWVLNSTFGKIFDLIHSFNHLFKLSLYGQNTIYSYQMKMLLNKVQVVLFQWTRFFMLKAGFFASRIRFKN